MFFLLFGNKVVRKDAGSIERTCPFCGVAGPHTLVQADNYFTFYWVPIFRLGKAGDQVRCRSCQQIFPLSMRVALPPAPATPWTCRTCNNVNPATCQACLKCGRDVRLE